MLAKYIVAFFSQHGSTKSNRYYSTECSKSSINGRHSCSSKIPKVLLSFCPEYLTNKHIINFCLASSDWKDCEELPVATDLGKDHQYHSIFVCPVTKEISTIDNPPMLLNCGHVISEYQYPFVLFFKDL